MFQRNLWVSAILLTSVISVQAAEIPQSATLQYRSNHGIPAVMTFQRLGDQYTILASINVPMYKIRFESGGNIVGNQLRPTYYTDTRNGKVYATANFVGHRATYGKTGERHTRKVAGSVMDLFTLSWQLALNHGKLPANLTVTNGKKLYPVGRLKAQGETTIKMGRTAVQINQFSVRRGDDDVHYAFAPDLNNVPVRIIYTDGRTKYQLTLKSVTINGKNITPK